MSGPRITDAAVEAGVSPLLFGYAHPQDQMAEDIVKDVLAAALPHIRRAVIEELVEKARARMKALQEHRIVDDTPEADEWETVARTWGWLRAEMEGDGE